VSTRSVKKRLSLRRLVGGRGDAPSVDGFVPTLVTVIDLEEPLPTIDGAAIPGGQPYGAAQLLVRQGGRPLGTLTAALPSGALPAAELRTMIEQRWGHAVSRSEPVAAPEHGPFLLPSPAPRVSVVVPTFRRPDDIARCVESILATDYPALEILVVDNAPHDPATATLIACRYAGDGRVRYLQEWLPGGSRARNRGVRASTGEIVAFADDDIVVDRQWLAALVAAFAANPDVSCVTGLVLPTALDMPVQLWFEQYGGFNRGYAQRMYDLRDHRGDTVLYPYTGGVFGGLGNAAFRRSVLKVPDAMDRTLGPGTPAFGAEDQDIFLTLLGDGGTLLYEPAALVRHRHRESYAELRWQVFTYGAGYVAGLVNSAVQDRTVAVELCRHIPAVIRFLVTARGHGESPEVVDYACRRQLRRLERVGQAYGPIAYLRAVFHRRRLDSRASRAVAGDTLVLG